LVTAAGNSFRFLTTAKARHKFLETQAGSFRLFAKDKGWEMYANDLDDQIAGMEKVIGQLRLPAGERPKNRGGQPSK
jgi:hypothetical protein